MKKLNLGCGTDIREGYINLDISNLPGVDVVHNIESLPLPFGDDTFDEIICQDVLEHVEYIPVLEEIYRIMKTNGALKIRVPHFSSKNNYIDPTHKKMFSWETFLFFVDDPSSTRGYYFPFKFAKASQVKITFVKGMYFYDYLLEPLINISNKGRGLYESTMLSQLFPAMNVEMILIK